MNGVKILHGCNKTNQFYVSFFPFLKFFYWQSFCPGSLYVNAAICKSTWVRRQMDQMLLLKYIVAQSLSPLKNCPHYSPFPSLSHDSFCPYSTLNHLPIPVRISTKLSWTKRRCTSATFTNCTTCTWKHKTTQVRLKEWPCHTVCVSVGVGTCEGMHYCGLTACGNVNIYVRVDSLLLYDNLFIPTAVVLLCLNILFSFCSQELHFESFMFS